MRPRFLLARPCRHLGAGLCAGALVACTAIRTSASEANAPESSGAAARQHAADISQAVKEKLPKYAPPTEKTPEAPRTAGEGEMSGDILKLPKVTVRPRLKEEMSEDAWLSEKGREDLAMKTYPGIAIGNLLGLNKGIALAKLREEREARKRAALAEEVERGSVESNATDRELKRLTKAAIQRLNSDWASGSGANPNRP